MLWKGRRQSGNVQDMRGMGGKGLMLGGVGTIAVIIIALLMGQNPLELLQNINQEGGGPATEQVAPGSPAEEEAVNFVKVVLADNEDVWHKLFQEQGRHYQEPKLVIFRGAVESGCGNAAASMGPFYCPADQKMYIDLSFYDDLKNRFSAPGDFAMAYVIAHEN